MSKVSISAEGGMKRLGNKGDWTPERVKRLTELWNAGVTAGQIKKLLGGVTRNAVVGKVHRLGLNRRPSPISGAKQEEHRLVRAPVRSVKAAPPPPVVPQPVSAVPDGTFTGPLMDFPASGRCKFPRGDIRTKDFQCCGAETSGLTDSWCPEHRRVVFNSGATELSSERAARRALKKAERDSGVVRMFG